MRRRSRTDENQPEIVKALRKAGCSVAITAALGHGFPDLVVATADGTQTFLLEVKMPGQKLTPDEILFMGTWTGAAAVVESVDDALAVMGITCQPTVVSGRLLS